MTVGRRCVVRFLRSVCFVGFIRILWHVVRALRVRKHMLAWRTTDFGTAELYKTRPCRWFLVNGSCSFADDCAFAHSADEWVLLPTALRVPAQGAAHWEGVVSIGVVEQALFEPYCPGRENIVCNRSTCLGNPFERKVYQDEEIPPRDENGWRAEEHEDLCAAFDEYFTYVLGHHPGEESLLPEVRRIASARSLALADTWVAQKLRRFHVRRALGSLERMLERGKRLRLLCHCRPNVRCHTEFLKAHLEMSSHAWRFPSNLPDPVVDWKAGWPGPVGDGPKCANCEREGRAMDPKNLSLYCAFCWMLHGENLKWQASQWSSAA